MKNIRGKHFSQGSLPSDLQNSIAGQQFLGSLLLCIVAIILGSIAGWLSSYVGALVGFRLIYVDLKRIEYITTGIILLIYLFTLLCKGLQSSLSISAASSIILLALIRVLSYGEVGFDISLGYEFAVLINLLINLTILLLGFLAASLSVALLKTMYRSRILIIIATLGLSFFVSLSGSVFSIAVGLLDGQTSTYNLSTLSSNQVFVTVICGINLSLSLALCSLAENKIVLKHFSHQSIKGFHQWAIALAACGGTSFHNLDLSKINFTGSKVAHTDFRASKFYRTCLRQVEGLEFAKTDNRYFDLASSKVQELLTTGTSKEPDFRRVNLRGAYLCDADLRRFNFSEANLDGADLKGADLRDTFLVRSILTNADLSQADLTGACIKDWSFNQQTVLTGVKCDYVYREFENNQPTDRYPSDRNFQPGEFESLFQKLTNAVELVFQDQIDWRALSFTFEKFRLEDDGMGLELKGIEQRGNYWIVKVTHGEGVSKQQVEQQVQSTYEDLRSIMEVKDKQINRLLGIVETQTEAMQRQAEALTNFSQQPFGNHFLISGSTITNLAGSGQIEYREAAHGVRSLITNQIDPNSNLQELLGQLKHQNVATTSATQRDLIQQVLLSEADRDPVLKQFLLEKGQHILDRLPDGEFKVAIRNAISLVRND